MRKRIAMLFSTVVLAACGGGSSDNKNEIDTQETLNVLSHMSPCVGVSQKLCLTTKSGNDTVNIFHSDIEGFDFTWGNQYELIINSSTIANPTSDGSSKQHKLKSITSQIEDAVGTQYEYKLVEMLESTFTKDADNYYFLGTPFVCGDGVDCESLVNLTNSGGLVNATFEYLGEGNIQLTNWN